MNRRRFLLTGAAGVAGAWISSKAFSPTFAAPAPLTQKVAASDVVVLGKTGIRTSRLAMGTGTVGSGHHSNQTALGLSSFFTRSASEAAPTAFSLARLLTASGDRSNTTQV